jgi:hypothetical protein
MSRTNVRDFVQPERHPRLARGPAARSVGLRGLFPPPSPTGGPGAAPDGPREQQGAAPRLSAPPGRPP